jgi:hypothetical protein
MTIGLRVIGEDHFESLMNRTDLGMPVRLSPHILIPQSRMPGVIERARCLGGLEMDSHTNHQRVLSLVTSAESRLFLADEHPLTSSDG